MYYVSENIVRALVTQEPVTECVRLAFIALAKGEASCFPIVRETLNYQNAIFGFKSGFDRMAPILGVKAGGLWPGNLAKGMANHQSTIILFDPETGAPHALVRGTYLTALRTAAASALSIRYLARNNASTLGIVGAGGQSAFQLRAALEERPFRSVIIFDRNKENTAKLASLVKDLGLEAHICTTEELCARSDVIITVTPSFEPLIENDWVKPGTHLACMGADTAGKQEVASILIARAELFGDVPSQAVTLGECQHAAREGRICGDDITTLGAVMSGAHKGRANDASITVFDSTGMALQDLSVAQLALDMAKEENLTITLE